MWQLLHRATPILTCPKLWEMTNTWSEPSAERTFAGVTTRSSGKLYAHAAMNAARL